MLKTIKSKILMILVSFIMLCGMNFMLTENIQTAYAGTKGKIDVNINVSADGIGFIESNKMFKIAALSNETTLIAVVDNNGVSLYSSYGGNINIATCMEVASGYVFDCAKYNGTTITDGMYIPISENVEIKVYAKIKGYTISYNTDGGSNVADATGKTVIVFPEDDPTKENCVFVGWYLDSTCNTKAVAGTAITADTTLYAKWRIDASTLIEGIQSLITGFASEYSSMENDLEYFEIDTSSYTTWLTDANTYITNLSNDNFDITADYYAEADDFYKDGTMYEELLDWQGEIESCYTYFDMLLVYLTDQYDSAINSLNNVLTVNGTDVLNNYFLSSFLNAVNQFKNTYLKYKYLSYSNFKSLMDTGKFNSDRDVSDDIIDSMESDSLAILELVREVEISTDANSKASVNGVYNLENSSSKTFNVDDNFSLSVIVSFNDNYKLSIIVNDIPGSSTNNNVFSGTISDTSLVSINSEIAGYTISYESNCSTTYENVTSDKIVFPEEDPTKDGFYFVGWYKNYDNMSGTYSNKATEGDEITADTTLYASWMKVINTEPNKDNDYEVIVNENITDTTYQWYKYAKSYINIEDSTEFELCIGTYDAENKTYSSGTNFSFQSIVFAPKEGVDVTKYELQYTLDNVVYTVGAKKFGKGDGFFGLGKSGGFGVSTIFTISNVKLIKYVGVALSDETNAQLGMATLENTNYYCEVIKDSEVIATSELITPKTISFVGGEDATGEAPESIYQLENRKFILPQNTFTKTDYMFNGWSHDDKKYVQGSTYTVCSSNIEFSALWITPHKCNDYTYEVELTNELIKTYYTTGLLGISSADFYGLPGGIYYLGEDICLNNIIVFGGDAVICLNGHIFDFEYPNCYINANGKLEIYDCKHGLTSHNYLANKDYFWEKTNEEATTDIDSSAASIEDGDIVTVNGGAIMVGYINGNNIKLKDVNIIGLNQGIIGNYIDCINCNFYGNYSYGNNGSCINASYINLYNSTFMYNTTKTFNEVGGQGTIYCSSKILVSGCTIKYNKAESGAGIFLDNVNTIATIIDSTISNNTATIKGAGVCYDATATCLLEGTFITMGDGSKVEIENIKVGDKVKSLNHETGLYESNKVIYVYAYESYEEVITLQFAGEKTLSIVGVHGLFCKEDNKYAIIDSTNYSSYIGKNFYDAASNSWIELLDASCESNYVTYYSVYVAKTTNCIANDLLTCPDDVVYMVNMYEFTTDNYLKADEAILDIDVLTYGLFDFSDCTFVQTEEEFNDYNGKYYNIWLGKGLLTERSAEDLYHEGHNYDQYISGIEGPALIIGKNVTIKNNYVNEKQENIYLSKGVNIYVIDGATNINAGITIENTIGDFALDVYSNNIGFTPDDNKLNIIKKENDSLYTYSLSYIKEQPTKDNDYKVIVNDNLKDEVTYQWYEDLGTYTLSELDSEEFTLEYYDEINDNSIIARYDEEFSYGASYVVSFYFINDVPCFIYFDCDEESLIVDGDYYSYIVSHINNHYIVFSKHGEFGVYTDECSFILENVKIQKVNKLTKETNAKFGTTTLNSSSYFCDILDNEEKLVERSESIKPNKISFDSNSGTGTTPNAIYELEGRTIIVPANPFTKTGYKFIGWNTDSTAKEKLNSYKASSEDTVLYAIWQEKETINLSLDNQRFTYSGNENIPVLIDNNTSKATSITGFSISYVERLNYTSVDVTSTINPGQYVATITRDEDDTYKAYSRQIVFFVSYSVTYNANGGVGEDYIVNGKEGYFYGNNSDYVIDGNVKVQTKDGAKFTKENYTLINWNTKADGTGTFYGLEATFDDYLTSNIILYACYGVTIKEQPTKTNDYEVIINTTDDVLYKWYKKVTIEDDTCEYNIAIGEKVGDTIASSNNRIMLIPSNYTLSYIKFKTTATLTNGISPIDGYYTYSVLFGRFPYIEINSEEDFVITDIKLFASSYEEMEDENCSKLENANENTSYYCVITSKYNINTLSDTISTCTINFEGNGNASGKDFAIYELEGRNISLPSNSFTKTGYKFVGWNTNKDAIEGLNSYTVNSNNSTLYAIWTEKVIVSIIEDAQTYTYNAKEQSFEIKGTNKDLSNFIIKYAYHSDVHNDDDWSLTIPTVVDNYDVKITRIEDEIYKSYEKVITNGLVINKYQIKDSDVMLAIDNFTYNGSDQSQSLIASYKDALGNDISLRLSEFIPRTNPISQQAFDESAIYDVSFILDTDLERINYEFESTESEYFYTEYEMKKKEIIIDWKNDNFTYNGEVQLITASYKDVNNQVVELEVTIDKEFKNTGSYIATVSFKNSESNYKLPTTISKSYTINPIKVIKPNENTNTYTYSGNEQTYTLTLNSLYTISNNTRTNAGSQEVIVSLNDEVNYVWDQEIASSDDLTFTFTINKLKVDEPTVEGSYKYNGEVQTPNIIGLKDYMFKSGTYSATEKGVYTINITLDNNYEWNDNSDGIITWEIKQANISSKEDTTDNKNEVIIETENGFTNDIKVIVEVTVEVEVETKELTVDYYNLSSEEMKLSNSEKVGVVFDVKLVQIVNGIEKVIQPEDIAPNTTIKVKMLIPESVDISKVTRILHVHSENDIETIEFDASKVVDGYYEIEVDRLSEFAFIYKSCINHYFLIGLLVLLIAFTAIIWFVFKIRSFTCDSELNIVPIIGFSIHLALLVLFSIMSKCRVCVIFDIINLIVLIGIVVLYLINKDKENKEETKEVKNIEATSLKEAIDIAKETNNKSIQINKNIVAEYLKENFKEDVILNRRENYIKSGILPLADTHYKIVDGKKVCFSYIYELNNGKTFFLVKTNEEIANKIKKEHASFKKSLFPKSTNNDWYTLIIDNSYKANNDVLEILKMAFLAL